MKHNDREVLHEISHALSSKTRLRIIEMLKKQEMRPRDIAEDLGCTYANAQGALKVLTNANLIVKREIAKKERVQGETGQAIIYSLNMATFEKYRQVIATFP